MSIPIKQIKSANTSTFSNPTPKSKTKPDRLIGAISKIFFIFYLISAIIIAGIIAYLAILPLRYLIALILALIFIAIVIGFLTFKRFLRRGLRYTIRIICSVISLALTGLLLIAFLYLNHTINFVDSIQASEYQIDSYSVFVKADSDFVVLDGLIGHTIAIYDDSEDNYTIALEELQQKIDLTVIDYGSSVAAANAFIAGKTDSIFIRNSLISIVSDITPDFNTDNLRFLDTIEIKTEVNATTSNVNITKDSFSIFVSGIDTYGKISNISRSDVNMIVTINPRTHTVLLASIPRDYYVQLHGTTGLKDKLTHAGLYGINMSINTLQDLFDIKIDYYIRVNFDSTINLIDAIDGIDITSELALYPRADGRCYFPEGETVHVYGRCALAYARERKAYGTGDLHRIQNQQEVMMAIIDKLTSSKVLLAKYTDILASMSGSLETNIPPSQIYKLVNEQLDSMPSWTIERISADGYHIDARTYTVRDQNLFVYVPYDESVTAVSEKIKSVMNAN